MVENHGIAQDSFLNQLRKTKTSVTLFLLNGIKLQGIVVGFDHFSILLQREGHIQLIYKHAISTLMPSGPISFPMDDNTDSDSS